MALLWRFFSYAWIPFHICIRRIQAWRKRLQQSFIRFKVVNQSSDDFPCLEVGSSLEKANDSPQLPSTHHQLWTTLKETTFLFYHRRLSERNYLWPVVEKKGFPQSRKEKQKFGNQSSGLHHFVFVLKANDGFPSCFSTDGFPFHEHFLSNRHFFPAKRKK